MSSLNCGFVSGGSVEIALNRILPMCGTTWAAIIRGLDSTRSRDALTKLLAFHQVPHGVTNGNVCVSLGDLPKSLEVQIFTGFDEVWIFSGSTPDFDLASLPSATSDAADYSATVPEEISSAIEKTNCITVLGDGCGLNYAVSDERIQRAIMKVKWSVQKGAGP